MKKFVKILGVVLAMAASFYAGVTITQKIDGKKAAAFKTDAIQTVVALQSEIDDEEIIINNLDALPAQQAITAFDNGNNVEFGLVHITETREGVRGTHHYEHITTNDRHYLVEAIETANERTESAKDYWYVAVYDCYGKEV